MDNQKFCQSCGMPLASPEDHGTNQNGSQNQDYCRYCYQNGAFVSECTMEEMADFCAPLNVEAGVFPDKETARAQLMKFFPTLKRWKSE